MVCYYTQMAKLALKTVTRTQGNNRALKEGTVTPKGYDLAFEEVPVLVDGFRRMVRGLEYDVSEMAITTYLCAKEHGVEFTALPIFLVRNFHHGAITYDTAHGPLTPKDLAGRRVGVSRGYTVTTGVWARSVLAAEYGVDLDQVTWVLSGDEHVVAYQPPGNVVPAEADLGELLAAGDLAAAIGVDASSSTVQPLIPNPTEAGLAALRERGHYPINHLVVVRDDVLRAHPDVAVDVFEAFTESKQRYVRALRAGGIQQPTKIDRLHRRVMEITGDDPLPYGIAPNRAVIDELLDAALDQHILRRRPAIEELFAANTLDLAG
jgi:4,5-dihydroxyphthalate decarboxylase